MSKFSMRPLNESDVTSCYVDWFKKTEISRYSDNQYRDFTIEGQLAYVQAMNESENSELYGIFDNELHIGNVVLSSINYIHRRAEVSYLVGIEEYWGRGVASYAVASAVELAKSKQLHKVYAGCASENLGSKRVLEKNKFELEGIRLDHLYYNGKWFDQLDFGLILT